MDDDRHVVIIEQPDGAMRDTPVQVARNGGAGRVRSNSQGSKSASAPVRSGKFKKQRVAPPKKKKIVRPIKWTRIRHYRTCYGARLDDEDIAFDMYQKARTLRELSSQKMFPNQDEAPNGLHLWTFKRQANAASKELQFANLHALFVSFAIAGLVYALWMASDLFSSNDADSITSTALIKIYKRGM